MEKQIIVTFTETQAELLMLAIIEVKKIWDKKDNNQMSKKNYSDISKNLQSIIDKVKIVYES